MFLPILLLFLCFLFSDPIENVRSADSSEIVDPLPGINFELNFKHFSGFLQVSSTNFLHYWLVTSQGNVEKDPLVFWFNGGPGCSSLDGLLSEMGPFVVNPDGRSLRKNPFAWNKYASIVYVESPAGVGYSYASDGNVSTNDVKTANENYEAIKQFFTAQPAFRSHRVFIMGESYAGIYVPTLTALILDGLAEFPLNLEGMMIGNGLLHVDLNAATSTKFAYGHGLVDEAIWKRLEQECCHGCVDGCNIRALNGSCGEIVKEIHNKMWYQGVNPYDLYRDCDNAPDRSWAKMEAMMQGLLPGNLFDGLAQLGKNALGPQKGRRKFLPCLNTTDMGTYMNLAETRKILRIPKELGPWATCSFDVVHNYTKYYEDMSPFVRKVVDANVRTLFYYGDTDMACNFLLGQQFTAQLGYEVSLDKRSWHFLGQIAGFKTIYSNGTLTYMTVRGAGHMVPQWHAPQADYIFSQFLRGGEF